MSHSFLKKFLKVFISRWKRTEHRHSLRRGTGREGLAGGHADGAAEALAAGAGEGAEGGFPHDYKGGGASRPEPGPGRRRSGGTGGMDQGLSLL